MRGGYFYLEACSQGKIDASYLVRTVSPEHTEVRVFRVLSLNRISVISVLSV